ncbi:hypothetical protein [Arsenophonus nasoniae]|uniref:Uncharacterized protein n=1 Tax=Arsenophonus nasoniae TaxID=638 RepID=A0AA95GCM3_9GAMM|nr:hypothetical protein [Arsenophonus nasoniae]WGL96237.1 hypothetical protein QE207_06595 [Arsenophonus nasoniae]
MSCQQAVSHSLLFHAHHCYFIEMMTSVLYTRINNLCFFLQLLLGFAVFSDRVNMALAGFIIAVVAAYQFEAQPVLIANNARQRALRYGKVIRRLDDSSYVDIQENIKQPDPKDNNVLLAIRKAGYIQSSIATGNPDTAKLKFKLLSLPERFIIFLAGGIQYSFIFQG